MATDYTKLLLRLSEKLSGNPSLTLSNNIVVPASAQKISERRAAINAMGLEWGSRIDVLSALPDRIKINWQSDKIKNTGEICMLNPFDAMNSLIFDSSLADKSPDELEKIIFDDHPESGDGCLTLMSITEDFDDIRLYYFNRNKIIPLTLSVEQYIEWLPVTKGYVHWPLLFCTEDYLHEGKNALPRLQQMAENLKLLFPDENYTVMEQQLNTLQE
jgi:hypothetical protein